MPYQRNAAAVRRSSLKRHADESLRIKTKQRNAAAVPLSVPPPCEMHRPHRCRRHRRNAKGTGTQAAAVPKRNAAQAAKRKRHTGTQAAAVPKRNAAHRPPPMPPPMPQATGETHRTPPQATGRTQNAAAPFVCAFLILCRFTGTQAAAVPH